MSSADRRPTYTYSEKGTPGVSGGLSGSKSGFLERLGRSKTVRGVLAGVGLLGIGAKYDQPTPVDFPREGVVRSVESFNDYALRDAVNFGSELEGLDELQSLREQIDEYVTDFYRSDFFLPVVVDSSETVSESRVLPRSTGELTIEQVGQVFSGGQVIVRIDQEGDNFTKATGRVMEGAVGSQLDPALRWRTTVALLGDNGLRPDEVKLVHHGDQFQLQVGEQTTGVLQEADLALGEAALSRLGSDNQSDVAGDPKVDQPETVQVEENSPPADDPKDKDKEGLPPVSGGGGGTSGGSTPGGGSGTSSGGSSGGANSGKEAAPAASPSDSGPAKEKVPDTEPAKEKVPALEPAKEKIPDTEAPPEKPPALKPPEKPGEEEREAPPARVVPPPRQEIVPPAAPPLVPPITGLAGADTIVFGDVQGESKVSPTKRAVKLVIKRDGMEITSGEVKPAPVTEANVFLGGQWSRVKTPAVPLDGFGQVDDGSFAIHSRLDWLQRDRKGPGVIERAVVLKGVQAGDEVELIRANGDVVQMKVIFNGFDDPQNVGKGEGEVVISTCDPDNMPNSLDDRGRLVIVAREVSVDKPGDNSVPVESGLPWAAMGAFLADKRRKDQERLRRAERGFRFLFGWERLFNREDEEDEILSALGEVK